MIKNKIFFYIIIALIVNCLTINSGRMKNIELDINPKLYLSYKSEIEVINLKTNNIEKCYDFDGYEILDFRVIKNTNDLIIYFNKCEDQDINFGIFYYSIKEKKINEIFKVPQNTDLYLCSNAMLGKYFFYIYDEDNFVKYEININKLKVNKNEVINNLKNNDIYKYYPIDNSEYFYVENLNSNNSSYYLIDKNNKQVFNDLKFDSIFYNINDGYYYYNYGYVYRICETMSSKDLFLKKEINLKYPNIINKIITFDNTNKYLFYEYISRGEFHSIGVIDLNNKKSFCYDIPIIGKYQILFD